MITFFLALERHSNGTTSVYIRGVDTASPHPVSDYMPTSAGSGNRTRKGLLPEVFETSASANSAIPAYVMLTTSYRVHAVAANRLGDKPGDKQVPRKDLRV